MIVRAAMIEFQLKKRGLNVNLYGDGECEIKRVRAFRAGARESATLYVASPGELGLPEARTKGFAVLAPASSSDEALSSASLLEAAYDALRELDLWESALKDALLKGASFDEFIELGMQQFTCQAAYFDRNLIILASSRDYWMREGLHQGGLMEASVEGQMPANLAADLVEDIDYLRAAEKREGFYYESAEHRIFYGINTFDGQDYLARLVFALPKGARQLQRGEEQLIDVYHAYLDDLHLRYAGSADVMSSQNDSLHQLARAVLLGEATPSFEDTAATLSSFGWATDDVFLVAKLVFFEGVHWDTVSLYLCNLLEHIAPGSCAFSLEQQIVWMVNLSHLANPAQSRSQQLARITESLVSILRNYACKAGISDDFESFLEARLYYLEADCALSLGQVRDPHYWYYRFCDYAYDYLLSKCTEDLSAHQSRHPALATLISHDAAYGSEYARTLVCYLRNSQNTTHAANELFIHRTSFMRRMAQINALVELHLDDPDEVLHLLLSAKLLGM